MKLPSYEQLFVLFLLAINLNALSQTPDFNKVPNLHEGDSVGIKNLIQSGTKVTRGKVIAWFPKDSLAKVEMESILDTLNLGILAAEKLIKAPHDWQVQQPGMYYTYYFRPENFVSHGSLAGFVSISFWRIKQRKAPWLHEALHEMLNTKAGDWVNPSISDETWMKNLPLWLSEGLPDYICLQVSQHYNLPQFDVFTNSLVSDVDSLCKENLKGDKAEYILSFIGKRGVIPELSGSERRLFAPTFYHCSCSFVKYLAQLKGIDPLVAGIAAYPREMEVLEKRFSQSIPELKKKWLTEVIER